MARSSLLGADRAPPQPKGRDLESLGPSDRSDSGSDMVGADEHMANDPGMPVDTALGRDDIERPFAPEESADGIGSDSGGTGERRSAAGDAGARDGADILPDRVFDPDGDAVGDDAEDPDLAFVDDAAAALDAQPDDEDDEDEDADPVGRPPR